MQTPTGEGPGCSAGKSPQLGCTASKCCISLGLTSWVGLASPLGLFPPRLSPAWSPQPQLQPRVVPLPPAFILQLSPPPGSCWDAAASQQSDVSIPGRQGGTGERVSAFVGVCLPCPPAPVHLCCLSARPPTQNATHEYCHLSAISSSPGGMGAPVFFASPGDPASGPCWSFGWTSLPSLTAHDPISPLQRALVPRARVGVERTQMSPFKSALDESLIQNGHLSQTLSGAPTVSAPMNPLRCVFWADVSRAGKKRSADSFPCKACVLLGSCPSTPVTLFRPRLALTS